MNSNVFGKNTNSGPLTGIKVLDLTINVLGPMATQMLGDMGADVIKIEAPGGDPMRTLGPRRTDGLAAHFLNFNRSKRSIELDLKQPSSLEELMCLIESADVFVHNMRTAAAERLGVGPGAICERNPNIIYAYATGYGQHGSKKDRPAYDDVIQGESGLAGMIGQANGEPRYVPSAMADKLCGVYLATAVNAALVGRQRNGRGQVVHVPMLETMTSFNLLDHMWKTTFTGLPDDIGYPRMFAPQRRPFPTKDGYICLLATTDNQWRRLFSALGRKDFAKDPRFLDMAGRTEHIDELYEMLGDEMLTQTTDEWCNRLDAADIPNGRMSTLSDVVKSSYLWETDFFSRYEHPSDGSLTTMAFPINFSETPAGMTRPPPLLGEHNTEILAAIKQPSKSKV